VDYPIRPEMYAQSDPPPFEHIAHSASAVTAGEKVQLALIGSRPRPFQRIIDEPRTLFIRPPKCGTKHDFAVFASKIQLLTTEVCYKVFFCPKNFQRQSCSYAIPESNGPYRWIAGNVHIYGKFALKVIRP